MRDGVSFLAPGVLVTTRGISPLETRGISPLESKKTGNETTGNDVRTGTGQPELIKHHLHSFELNMKFKL